MAPAGSHGQGGYVALFPGLGGRVRPVPAGLSAVLAPVWWVFETIDEFADRIGLAAPSALLAGPAPGSGGEDLRAELMLFGLSVGLHEALAARVAPVALLGHSLGFLPALVSAQAFTVTDGCHIIHLRHRALERTPPPKGGMISIDIGLAQAVALATAIGGLTVACANTPTRTVLCGLDEPLGRVQEQAHRCGWEAYRLPVRHPYHGTHLAQTLRPLRAQLGFIRQQPLLTPVFSATTRRFCSDHDDLLTDFIDAIAEPVWFSDAVQHLHAWGAQDFVECGPAPMLASLARQCVPGLPTRLCFDQAARLIG